MRIGQMESEHLAFAAALVRQAGWDGETRPVFEDFLAYDPAGCFIATQGSGAAGRPVGLCVAVRYQRQGFIGELIVAPDQRGQGIGTALFRHALAYASPGMHQVGLDGDAPGVPIYAQAGFKTQTRSLRFYGHVPGQAHARVRPMTEADLPSVIQLDRVLFGDDRSFFLQRRFERHAELCFVATGAAGLSGYIMGRPGLNLLTVGPWAVLPDLGEPGALLQHLALAAGGPKLRIGVLESHPQAAAWLRNCSGLVEGEASQRMVLELPANRAPGARPLGMPAGAGDHPGLWAIGSSAKG